MPQKLLSHFRLCRVGPDATLSLVDREQIVGRDVGTRLTGSRSGWVGCCALQPQAVVKGQHIPHTLRQQPQLGACQCADGMWRPVGCAAMCDRRTHHHEGLFGLILKPGGCQGVLIHESLKQVGDDGGIFMDCQ